MKPLLFPLLAGLLLTSCNQPASSTENQSQQPAKDSVTAATVKPSIRKVLTAAEQQALSPDSILQSLIDGNKRFAVDKMTARNDSAMVQDAVSGQHPMAVVLSCIDSRVPVEEVFDKGIGDLFVTRVAGNVVNEDILGSLEYSCQESGAKLILVLGHESCGAIKAAIEGVKLGNITAMLAKVQPALAKSQNFKGEKTVENSAYVEAVVKNNILNTIELIKKKSPVLKAMLDKGEIKMVGAYYSLKTGEITLL
ncbi:MAG TPA: carbonic anhydrase family protein [Puia sp.]|nr:carbonic anhydrase family protein [Puia sp.]